MLPTSKAHLWDAQYHRPRVWHRGPRDRVGSGGCAAVSSRCPADGVARGLALVGQRDHRGPGRGGVSVAVTELGADGPSDVSYFLSMAHRSRSQC